MKLLLCALCSIVLLGCSTTEKPLGPPQIAPSIPAGLPDGTTTKWVGDQWALIPPTIEFQERKVRDYELEEVGQGGSLGRFYHVKNLLTGKAIEMSRSKEEMERRASELNKQEETTYYYVFVGTEY